MEDNKQQSMNSINNNNNTELVPSKHEDPPQEEPTFKPRGSSTPTSTEPTTPRDYQRKPSQDLPPTTIRRTSSDAQSEGHRLGPMKIPRSVSDTHAMKAAMMDSLKKKSDAFLDKIPLKSRVGMSLSSSATQEMFHSERNEQEPVLSDLSKSYDHSSLKEKIRSFSPVKRNKKHDGDREKKHSRISQLIQGVTYKSKSELFKKLFKDMPGEEQLIVDYSCALHRDILVHGRLYLSQNWFCFYANILGWETLVTMQWTEITAITKEKTARVIPNAIQMCTSAEKYFFTTFVTREHAYTALFRIWQNALLGQPLSPVELKRLCKKYRQKKMHKDESIQNDHDETGDEAIEDDESLATSQELNGEESAAPPVSPLDSPVDPSERTLSLGRTERPSLSNGSHVDEGNEGSTDSLDLETPALNNNHSEPKKAKAKHVTLPKSGHHRPSSPFARHAEHFFKPPWRKKKKLRGSTRRSSYHLNVVQDPRLEESTEFEDEDSDSSGSVDDDEGVLCPCHDAHEGKEYANEEYNFDVDALYEHLFSQESDFMKRVYDERKFENWRYTPLEPLPDGGSTQTLEYTLHLNYSVGPKTSDTKSTHIIHGDNKPNNYYVIDTQNRSYGVPYSDSFHVFTRYCLTRTAGNGSRLQIHGGLTYTKRVFGLVKNMINKNADEATRDYFDFLSTALRSESDLLDHAPLPVKVSPKKNKKKAVTPLVREASSKQGARVAPSSEMKSNVTKETADSNVRWGFFADMSFPTSSKGFLIFLILLFALLFSNLYLFGRLRSLENSIAVARQNWIPKELPTTKEDWFNLLEYQRGLHDQEMIKLKEVVGSTALLVKHVESSITQLYAELESSLDRKESNEKITVEKGPGEVPSG